jgi:hypothetical protein
MASDHHEPALISIAHIPLRVAALTGQPAPRYRTVYDAALRGLFPTSYERGRWYVATADLPLVVSALAPA